MNSFSKLEYQRETGVLITMVLGIVVFAGCNGAAKQAEYSQPEHAREHSAPQLTALTKNPDSQQKIQDVALHQERQVDQQKPENDSADKPQPQNSQPDFSGKNPGALTLAQLLAIATENNPEIAAARSKAAAQGWKFPQVTSLDDPIFNSTVFLDAIETAGGSQDVIVSLSQKLPWFGKLKLRGEIANAQAEALWYEAERVRLKIIEQVRHSYYDYAYLASARDTLKRLEPTISSVIDTTRRKFRNEMNEKKRIGYETVLQAEIELYRLRTQIAEIEETQKRVLARLKELINSPEHQSLNLQVTQITGKIPANLERLLALVDQCQPELLARMWDSQRDAAAVSLAGKNYYPDFTIGANWYAIGNSGLSRVANGDDAASLMFGINVPIYRQRLRAADSESRLKYFASRHQEESTANRFRADVAGFHADAVASNQVLAILEENIIKRARRSLDLSVQSWRQDRIEFQRLIDNYQNLIRFEIAILERRRAVNKSLASLERAVGCALESWPAAPAPAH
ncbi:MAG: hypothetical protein Tsb009_24390 [Planctomycetaceae bacterium]